MSQHPRESINDQALICRNIESEKKSIQHWYAMTLDSHVATSNEILDLLSLI